MEIQNYYKSLGLSQESSGEELYVQCKELFLKCHPNRNDTKEAAETFIIVNDAYVILFDEKIREQYDYLLMKYSDGKLLTAEDSIIVGKIKELIIERRKQIRKMYRGSAFGSVLADFPALFLPGDSGVSGPGLGVDFSFDFDIDFDFNPFH